MKLIFEACRYQGRPAVFDTVTRVFYTGYRSMRAARARARELNEVCK